MIYGGSTDDYNRDYVDIGNYNYGVVAAAAGLSWPETLVGAAIANHGERSLRLLGANPVTVPLIKKGYDDYMTGKIAP